LDALFVPIQKKLVEFACEFQGENAIKYVGILFAGASASDSRTFLPIAIPAILNRMLKSGSKLSDRTYAVSILGPAFQFADGLCFFAVYRLKVLSPVQLQFFLYALAQSAKQGSAGEVLLNYVDEFKHIYLLCWDHKERAVRKQCAKMFRAVLRGLTQVYPLEYRSFPPKLFNDPSWKSWQHWSSFGTTFDKAIEGLFSF
jgi:hypothetical protein